MFTPIREITIQNKVYEMGKEYDKVPDTFECWFREVVKPKAKKKSSGTATK